MPITLPLPSAPLRSALLLAALTGLSAPLHAQDAAEAPAAAQEAPAEAAETAPAGAGEAGAGAEAEAAAPQEPAAPAEAAANEAQPAAGTEAAASDTGAAEAEAPAPDAGTDAAETPAPGDGADAAEAPADAGAEPAAEAAAEVPVAEAEGSTPAPAPDEAAPDAAVESIPLLPAADPALQEAGVPTGMGHDLSPRGMFMAADWVVKGVMGILVAAFVITLVIWLAKMIELRIARRRLRRGAALLARTERLEEAIAALAGRRGAVALMVRAAEEEARLSLGALDHAGVEGLKERVASRLSRMVAASGRGLTRGTGILATVGAVAPFVGLFGTVWGIMNSFIGIAETQTTNLAVVAPGIAEALLATATGLVAAIPAVVIYNAIARAVTGYRQRLGDAAAAIERLVSRDLDWRRVPAPAVPAPAVPPAEPPVPEQPQGETA